MDPISRALRSKAPRSAKAQSTKPCKSWVYVLGLRQLRTTTETVYHTVKNKANIICVGTSDSISLYIRHSTSHALTYSQAKGIPKSITRVGACQILQFGCKPLLWPLSARNRMQEPGEVRRSQECFAIARIFGMPHYPRCRVQHAPRN